MIRFQAAESRVAARDPQLADGCATRTEQLELAGDREGHALEHRACEGRSAVAVRQPSEGAAQVRVGPLAVTEDREGDHAIRPRRHGRGLGVEPRIVGGARATRSPAVQQARQPGDRRAGRVDPGLGRERAGDDVRVVGHRQDVERLGDGRVEAGRRAGHLAHRTGGHHPGAEGAGLAVRPADHDREPVRQADPGGDRRSQPTEDVARRTDRREQ